MNQSSEQKKRESAPKPKSGKTDERGNQPPPGDAKARGQGENPAANSSNPKERSPRQENL